MSKEFIAKKLKEYREKSGITVSEIAERFGKSIKTIYSWESGQGQPDADTLIELCSLYGIDDFAILNENVSEMDIKKEAYPSETDEYAPEVYELAEFLENNPAHSNMFEYFFTLNEEEQKSFVAMFEAYRKNFLHNQNDND